MLEPERAEQTRPAGMGRVKAAVTVSNHCRFILVVFEKVKPSGVNPFRQHSARTCTDK